MCFPLNAMQQCDGWGPPEAEAGTVAESLPEVVLKRSLRPWRTCLAGKIIDGRPMNRNQPDANTGKHGSSGPECLRLPGWEFSALPEAILVFFATLFFLLGFKRRVSVCFPPRRAPGLRRRRKEVFFYLSFSVWVVSFLRCRRGNQM